MHMKKKKLVPRNPLVIEAKFKKAGLMEKTKRSKNRKERVEIKEEVNIVYYKQYRGDYE